MAEPITPKPSPAGASARGTQGTFPDPSLSLVEFGEGLGLLIAERTERDAANKRLVLKKVAYVRLLEKGWGAMGHAELWIEQDAQGTYRVVDPKSNNILRHPSRRRYEVAFLTREVFDVAIQCLKERDPEPIYELVLVTFGTREGFSVEEGNLLAPSDYADVRQVEQGREWLAPPPVFGAEAKK